MNKVLVILALVLGAFQAHGAIKVYDSENAQVGIFHQFKCGSSLNCSRESDKLLIQPARVQSQVVATATTITSAECGSSFINAGAVQMELPEASTVLGCRLTFITGNASNFDVNPDDADQILVETDAVGDAIRNATLGNSITLEAISASQWTLISVSGTYADIN